jgi:transcriptional regulator with XRE-family HTH domain
MSEMSLMTGTIRIIMNLYSYGQEVMWMYIGDSDIGEIIRILRTERGMSREELAERVGISRSHLNKVEADIKRPSILTYQKIMDVLEADISIQNEEKTEKGKCVAKARDILMNRSEKEVKYLVKMLQCAADNLDMVF